MIATWAGLGLLWSVVRVAQSEAATAAEDGLERDGLIARRRQHHA